jgi:hypothetical protein
MEEDAKGVPIIVAMMVGVFALWAGFYVLGFSSTSVALESCLSNEGPRVEGILAVTCDAGYPAARLQGILTTRPIEGFCR